jgi:hypothetical protein
VVSNLGHTKERKQRETKIYTLLELFEQEIKTDNLNEKDKFLDYWTAKNRDGRKELWQKKEVFDVKRRWAT